MGRTADGRSGREKSRLIFGLGLALLFLPACIQFGQPQVAAPRTLPTATSRQPTSTPEPPTGTPTTTGTPVPPTPTRTFTPVVTSTPQPPTPIPSPTPRPVQPIPSPPPISAVAPRPPATAP